MSKSSTGVSRRSTRTLPIPAFFRPALVAATILISGTVVAAQGPDEDAIAATDKTDEATRLERVTVTGRAAPVPKEADDKYKPTPDASTLRTDAPLLEIPQIVNVVPAQVLRDQRPRYLDDALINISGITQGNTLAGTQDTLLKRGFGGNRDGSIMHNGMPLVQGRGLNAAAESVEVLKGPSSLLYGIMDPGGVINVVSKKPRVETHTTVSATASGYAGGKLGSEETVDTTGPIGDRGLAYRLILDRIDEQYWRNFGSHRDTLFAPSVAWYGRDTQAVFWYEHRDFLTPFDRGTATDPRNGKPLDIPATRRLDEPFNEMNGESHLGQLSVDHRLGGTWMAHVNASYNRETYDANQLRVSGVDPARGTLTRSNDATHDSLSTDSYATAYIDGKFHLADMRHDVQLGYDIEYRKFYRADLLRQATRSVFSDLNPVYGTEAPSQTVSPSDSDQTDKLRDDSVFLQDSVHLSDRWIAVFGGRFQRWNQIAGRGRPFIANTTVDGSKWLPRFGLVYRINDVASVYGSFTQSLKPTSTIAPLSSGVVVTSSIAPEEGKSYEIGTKLDLADGVTATLAAYNINKRNVLVSQFNSTTLQTDYRTAGKARSRGVEFDLAGRLSERWSTIVSYAYTSAKTIQDPLFAGLRLTQVARQTGSVSGVYDVGEVASLGRLRLGATAHYVGARPGDSANSFILPSYKTLDAFATFDTHYASRNVKLQLNVRNLFDRLYYPSSVNQNAVAVGDARQILLTASTDF